MGQHSPNQDQVVTASELLSGAFDPARLHPLANLKDSLEYLVLDDDKTTDLPGATTALPSRGWSDDLQYGTGTTYLSGESALRPARRRCVNGTSTVQCRAAINLRKL